MFKSILQIVALKYRIQNISCVILSKVQLPGKLLEVGQAIRFLIHGISVSQFKKNHCGVLSFSCLVTTSVSCGN